MADWQGRAAQRWDELRRRAAGAGLAERPQLTVAACAAAAGLRWFDARSGDLLKSFLALPGRDLLRTRNLGMVKVLRLISIVESMLGQGGLAAETDEQADAKPDETRSKFDELTLGERLVMLGVPRLWPCALTNLPTRIENYCHARQFTTLIELLMHWQEVGIAGLMKERNLGRKSVAEVEAIASAVLDLDAARLSHWLPLDPSVGGMSVQRGLVWAVKALDPIHRAMLERRLVRGLTLEESARDFGVTRERVRQVEDRLMILIQRLLKWFPDESNQMLQAWMVDEDWHGWLNGIESEDDRQLIIGALEAEFQSTPQAVAKALDHEARLESWHAMLQVHPDLLVEGVDLGAFMTDHVPPRYQQDFCLSLNGRGRIRLDHATGRVVHSDPLLREVVKSILAREDDPIPLTWLVHLVRQTSSHHDIEREQIARYRVQWKSDDPSFPRHKVLWHE